MNKVQWDYIGNFRIGNNTIIMQRPMYCVYVSPSGDFKKILMFEGETWHE